MHSLFAKLGLQQGNFGSALNLEHEQLPDHISLGGDFCRHI